jgi:hypothetical protein
MCVDCLSRAYYFQIDDPNELGEWIASLHRDRFQVVRDERDAYRQLQDHFSGEMDSANKLVEHTVINKDRLQNELAMAQTQADDSQHALQSALLKLGVSMP